MIRPRRQSTTNNATIKGEIYKGGEKDSCTNGSSGSGALTRVKHPPQMVHIRKEPLINGKTNQKQKQKTFKES